VHGRDRGVRANDDADADAAHRADIDDEHDAA